MAYSTINKSTDFFNTKLYTGNGGTNAITGVGFQPDFTWIKSRSQTANHYLYDAVRGVENKISTNATGGEIDMGTSGLNTFGTDGFTVGNDTDENNSGSTYASWNWKAGGGQGSSNTDGSINTTYTSVNTTAGFSISKYTGTGANATIGHGLGSVPKMIITKKLNSTENWKTYHASLGNDKKVQLDTNNVSSSFSGWNDTTPTSSLIYFSDNAGVNGSGDTYVAYAFAEKTGYSKFGSYVGNGSTDGSFIYTGFKPAFIIIKGAVSGNGDAAQNWELYDNKRLGYNVDNNTLFPNTNSGDSTSDRVDIFSNGFKIIVNSDGVNDTNSTYIYMAFGQSIVGSNNVPCTAR